MNSEAILRSVAFADPEYLEQALKPQKMTQRSKRKARFLVPIAAVFSLMLLAAGVAAAVIYGPHIVAAKTQEDSFDLILFGGDAAEDAPGYLAQYYLPAQLPEGSRLKRGMVSWISEMIWTVPIGDTEGEITFHQVALRKDLEEYPFLNWSGIDLDDMKQDNQKIGGVSCWIIRDGSFETYFWNDPENHYLLYASFNEPIPQKMREDFLNSVAPASQTDVCRMMDVEERTVWYPNDLPDRFEIYPFALYVSNDPSETGFAVASDHQGRSVTLVQGKHLSKEEFDSFKKSERDIDEISVCCYVSTKEMDGGTIKDEVWCFTLDGKTELQLDFCSCNTDVFTEADMIEVFRGLAEVPIETLDLVELNRNK